MKKNILSFCSMLLVVLLFSCDEKEWVKEEINLVPVYSITDINGISDPVAIDVYQTKPLIIWYESSVSLNAFETADYIDASTDSTYQISYSFQNPDVTSLGADTTITTIHSIEGKKDEATSILSIGIVGVSDTITTDHVIAITETEKYN